MGIYEDVSQPNAFPEIEVELIEFFLDYGSADKPIIIPGIL